MSPSSPDVVALAVRINIPPEAMIPLLIGAGALLVLVFAGGALRSWKERSPGPASKFGLVVGSLCTVGAIYFLAKSIPNQIDPNSDGTGQLSHIDPPIGAFMTVLACSFFRMGGKRKISLGLGLLVGIAMLVKPFILPVIVTYAENRYGGSGSGIVSRSRTFLDPEHLEFIASGIVVIITALITGSKPLPPAARAYPPPPYPPPGQYPPPGR